MSFGCLETKTGYRLQDGMDMKEDKGRPAVLSGRISEGNRFAGEFTPEGFCGRES